MKLVLIALFLLTLFTHFASADDGIPNNCENTRGTYYNPNLFANYEANNWRLLIRDWATGADVLVLGTDLADTLVRSWSPSCRYLLTAEVNTDTYTTVVWDTVNGGRVGQVPDAHGIPHPTTWGANDALIVETRNGGILWNVPNNTQVTLTIAFDPITVRNFTRLRWDAANNQLIANLVDGNRKVFDMVSGQEVAVAAVQRVEPNNDTLTVGGKVYECISGYWQHSSNGTLSIRYDEFTNQLQLFEPWSYRTFYTWSGENDFYWGSRRDQAEEIVAVIDSFDVAYARFFITYNCQYAIGQIQQHDGTWAWDTVVYSLSSLQKVAAFKGGNLIAHPYQLLSWRNSMVIQTRDGAYLWHYDTDTRILLKDAKGNSPVSLRYYVGTTQNPRLEYFDTRQHQNAFAAILPDDIYVYTKWDATTGEVLGTFTEKEYRANYYDNYSSSYTYQKSQMLDFPPPPANPIEGVSSYGNLGGDTCSQTMRVSNTGESLIVENAVTDTTTVLGEVNPLMVIQWSPDCRYLVADVFAINPNAPYDEQTINKRYGGNVNIWDTQTGTLMAVLDHTYRTKETRSRAIWSADSRFALIRTYSGYYLINFDLGQTFLLTFGKFAAYGDSTNNPIGLYPKVYWDYERGQMLVNTGLGIYAIDLWTGEERYRFYSRAYPFDYINFRVDETSDTISITDGYEFREGFRFTFDRPNRIYNLNTGELLEGGE